jgi:DNA invertase Pin-like site-specific DNA recombinase
MKLPCSDPALQKRLLERRRPAVFWAQDGSATSSFHGVLMLTVLGGLAEFERTLIRARTGEGRERAKVRGVRFGRPLKLSPHQRREAIERLDAGDTVVDVARTFGVDRATLYRMRAEVSG